MYIVKCLDVSPCKHETTHTCKVENRKEVTNDYKDAVDIITGLVGLNPSLYDPKIVEEIMGLNFGEKYGPVYMNNCSITVECVPDEEEEADILAPCPFCGHKAELDYLYYDEYACDKNKPVVRWSVYCHSCGCTIDYEYTVYEINVKTGKMDICGEDGRLKLIHRWNRSAKRF